MPEIEPSKHPGMADAYALQESKAPNLRIAQIYHALAEAFGQNNVREVERLQKELDELKRSGRKRIALWNLDALFAYQPDPHDNILGDGILYAGEAASLIGAPGIGKSRMAFQAAIAAILHREFLGWKTNAPGRKWLFLQTENSARRLKYDLEKMCSGLSVAQMATLRECLLIMNVEEDENGTIYMTGEDRMRIEDTIAEHDPLVIVVDPLSDSTTGDLNSDVDMSEAAASIKRVVRAGNAKRLPLIVHHARPGSIEASKVFGDDAATFARNSKRLLGAIRSQINVAPAGDAYPGVIILGCGKLSNSRAWKPFAAMLDEATMTYQRLEEGEFDLEEWAESMADAKKKKRERDVSPQEVAELVQKAGGKVRGGERDRDGLMQRIQREFKVSRPSAKAALNGALGETIQYISEQGMGHRGATLYILKEDLSRKCPAQKVSNCAKGTPDLSRNAQISFRNLRSAKGHPADTNPSGAKGGAGGQDSAA